MVDVSLSCPLCGAELRVSEDPNPQSAPYVCDADSRAWWGSELTGEARDAFDPTYRTYSDLLVAERVREGIRDEVAQRRVQQNQANIPTPASTTPDPEPTPNPDPAPIPPDKA